MNKKELKTYSLFAVIITVSAYVFNNAILNWIVGSIGWVVLLGGTPIVHWLSGEFSRNCSKEMRENNTRFAQFIWLSQVLFVLLLSSELYK